MTRAAFATSFGPEFGPFLFAAIGEDPNGKLLSVLSAFARTEIDPWQEAASLARMPREVATDRLASFISALPDNPNSQVPARALAGELIALLPHDNQLSLKTGERAPSASTPTESRLGLGFTVVAIVIAILLMSSTNFAQKSAPGANLSASGDKSTTRIAPSELGH